MRRWPGAMSPVAGARLAAGASGAALAASLAAAAVLAASCVSGTLARRRTSPYIAPSG